MVKKTPERSVINNTYFFVILPVIFVLMVVTYLIGVRISSTNSKVCTFLGRIWLAGNPDPNSLKGCYTYEQLAQKGAL